MAHLQIVDPADLSRFAELGVIAQFSPNWAAVDPSLETIRSRIGEQRCSRMYLLRDMLERGAAVTFGTDWPAAGWFSTYKPLDAIETAVTRRTLGEPDAPALEPQDQCLDLAQALHANTLAAARQLRLDDLVGSLEAGKRADLVVLERNVFEIPSHRIAATGVDMTMMNGRFTHGDPFAGPPPNG
jgi:predicted amidohydrolase YtcJ